VGEGLVSDGRGERVRGVRRRWGVGARCMAQARAGCERNTASEAARAAAGGSPGRRSHRGARG